MKPLKFNIQNILLEIRAEITVLNVEEAFRNSLLEDIELAVKCFSEKNILSVLNCMAVLASKLHTHVISSHCHFIVVEKLLVCIHQLQQILIRLPVCIVGPTGATGATGPTGYESFGPPICWTGVTGPIGPSCETGPSQHARSTAIITKWSPVACSPIPVKTTDKPVFFDFTTHVVTYCKPHRKR